jgi:threonine/homoserine/homoserine lactone efflux protein
MPALMEGLLAGYGIAIPVGAMTILIVETTLRRGFTAGFVAGSGTATVDFLYAAVAAVAGSMLSIYLAPHVDSVRAISAILLIGLGIYGLRRSMQRVVPEEITQAESSYGKLYIQFFVITAINPLTVIYFSALILGGILGDSSTSLDRLLFIFGAGFASFSWQSILAFIGALLRKGISARARLGMSLVGNLVVVGLGLRLLLR